jgi:hypothetical protein
LVLVIGKKKTNILMNIKNSTIIPIKTPFLRKKLDENFSSIIPSARKYQRSGRGVPLYEKSNVLEIFSVTFERCKRFFLEYSRHSNIARKVNEILGWGIIQFSKTEVQSSLKSNASRASELSRGCATVIPQEEKMKALLHKLSHLQLFPTKSSTLLVQDSEASSIDARLDNIQSLKNLCDEEAICKLILTDNSEVVRARAIEALADIKSNDEEISDFSRNDVTSSDTSNDSIEFVNEIQKFLSQFENVDVKKVQSLVRSVIIKHPELKEEWQILLKDEDTVESLRYVVPCSSTLINTIKNEVM